MWWFYSFLLASSMMIGSDVYCELFSSTAHLQELIETEKAMIEALSTVVKDGNIENDNLTKILNEWKAKRETVDKDGLEHLYNPINSFLLIKRLTRDMEEVKALIVNATNKELVLDMRSNRQDLKFPDHVDYYGALNGLTVLQKTYNLSILDLVAGRIDGAKQALAFTADDCLEVGYYCYNSYMLNESISWMINGMMKAKIKGEEGRFNFTETFVHIARALYLSGNVNDSYGLAHQISKGTPLEKAEYTDYEEYFNTTKMRESTNYYRNVVEQSENDSENILNLKLCREEDVQNKKVRSKLRCYMKKCLHHPYCNLVRYKLEEISKDPFIVRYYDLITDDEILGVIKNSTSMITRALLFDSDNKPVISDERITKSGWLFPNGDANMMRIDSRLEMATGMDLRSSEPLQVANYGLGGYYSKHADFFLESQLEDWKAIGNRLATALYYLSNVEKGGSTTFPELKLFAKPIKGSVVFWYNLHRNGMGDMRTFHSACPVLLGNKWVANRWIHERRQDVTRPCSLNKDE